ncbi:hypothetical protein BGZ61DRAFT_549770 [Ilyonectria robusta]|uniref:uncharacterized protein n=1 Tax=Ilyonectria robusta TaxID=1079257 RepID=UPI001E8E8C93|nr:uncharacterized protein BGZ61DRAFT_549770 [Ilyonectria robusta]KAH8684001.1 hypothetical protein BGZ61DRAFT_549770 [Ilyonectria robusta]
MALGCFKPSYNEPRVAHPRSDRQLAQALWPGISPEGFRAEVGMYTSLLERINAKLDVVDSDSSDLHPITSEDLLRVIDDVRRLKRSPRTEILGEVKKSLSPKTPSDDSLSKAIDVAAGLWLTLDIRSSPPAGLSGVLHWADDQSIISLVNASFQTGSATEDVRKGSVKNSLTVANLVSNHDFRILWTHNLADHLKLDRDSRVLTVYEHKICLRNHRRSSDSTALPLAIAEEAIDTLNLLFPRHHHPTKSLLRKHGKSFGGLGTCGQSRTVELSKYPFWGERVEALSKVLDEVPVGAHQFMLKRDGKNALQFATFWIATAIGILTIISFVTGVISAVYAQKAYDLALLQYQLSLAQACSVPDTAAQLSRFCS